MGRINLVIDENPVIDLRIDEDVGMPLEVTEQVVVEDHDTAHTIEFEFGDGTSTTLTGYWDAAFVTSAITATKPETYDSKTVETASLDGTVWYTRPTDVWETLFDGAIPFYPEDGEDVYPYCWIQALSEVEIAEGSVWKVTYDNTEYRLIGRMYQQSAWNRTGYIGNLKYGTGEDDGSGVPFYFYNTGYGAWSGGLEGDNVQRTALFKIERLVTA